MIGDRILQNFAVYLDGTTLIGETTEVQLPKITVKTVEYNGAGMSGTIEIDTGKIEKLETSMKLKGIQTVPIGSFGEDATKPLILRAAIKNSDGTEKKLVIEMRGLVKEIDYGTWNAEDIGETSVSMTLQYYRFSEDGTDLIIIDPINNIRNLNGKDQLEGVVSALS
ncbi:phage major tail tube protein [Thiotrichales bacterium 19X7-9]|nr:phage major tail tube protein [Thiotrichales bacterium 19X7-9]